MSPRRALRPCGAPACPALVESGLCPEHKLKYNRQRGSSWKRGYSAGWKKIRDAVLAEEPNCRECKAAGRLVRAIQVDHIVRRRDGGTDERSNLRPLCLQCHGRKTALYDGAFGNPVKREGT